MMRASVVGGSGYIGGELIRLLLGHPALRLAQATSTALAGRPVHEAHPNLRGHTDARFVPPEALADCDILFLAAPPGVARARLDEFAARAPRLIDLGPDFRPGADGFTPGFPEIHRDRLATAARISMPGCMANAAVLALRPLRAAGLVRADVHVDGRTGSSGSGRRPSASGQHAERSGALRVYQTFDHRHGAEIDAACDARSRMSVTAVEAVRGVQVLVHARGTGPVRPSDVWECYRAAYRDEPFVRLTPARRGRPRLPEPKILAGTNWCDIGFDVDADGTRMIAVAALDNLVKGGAGNAVQCANIATGLDETAGLAAIGLHPS